MSPAVQRVPSRWAKPFLCILGKILLWNFSYHIDLQWVVYNYPELSSVEYIKNVPLSWRFLMNIFPVVHYVESLWHISFLSLSVLFHVLLQNCFNLCKLWPYFHGKRLLKSVKFHMKHIFLPWKHCLCALWRLHGNTNEISLSLCITMYLCYFSPIPVDIFLSSYQTYNMAQHYSAACKILTSLHQAFWQLFSQSDDPS